MGSKEPETLLMNAKGSTLMTRHRVFLETSIPSNIQETLVEP